jgi:pimeloyl-ACP methyl ester carboxylesterase
MLTLLFLYFYLGHIMRAPLKRRWDGSPAFGYVSVREAGVHEERFSFFSGKWLLSGSRYYAKKGQYKALVVFFHGIGSGRNAYNLPIIDLVKQGFLVYAYDNTGSMESEGPCIYGLGQTNKDMRAFFAWLDHDKEAQGLRRYVVGHSWGGYSALMALQPEYKIDRCVSIAGFTCSSDLYVAMTKNFNLKPLKWLIKLNLYNLLGPDGDRSAVPLLQKTPAQVLYIQGDKDPMVPPEAGYLLLQKELPENPHIHYLVRPNRHHQCFLSPMSEKYLEDLMEQGLTSLSCPPGLKMELNKACEEDPEVMKAIFDFLLG